MLKWILALLGAGLMAAATEVVVADDCLRCHQERDRDLVNEWRNGPHNRPGVDCRSCHGERHDGAMAARSRTNDACLGCHFQTVGSYSTSKHGVLVAIEGGREDYSRSLSDAHYRSPTCGYCHLHLGKHGMSYRVEAKASASRPAQVDITNRLDQRMRPCRDCHSPRFVETWFATGDRMVEIGGMKMREAMAVVQEIARRDPMAALKARIILYRSMLGHLKNVKLGVGHQSPDRQWWYGQAALDGDLLRIKSILHEVLVRPEGG